jgi:hypothetical protein
MNSILTSDDCFFSSTQILVSPVDENEVKESPQFLIVDFQVFQVSVSKHREDERLPQRVHVADHHRRKEDLVQRNRR